MFSRGVSIFFYREAFEDHRSTKTNSKAETLRDNGASSACWTRMEASQPTEIPGGEQYLLFSDSFDYSCLPLFSRFGAVMDW